MLKNTLRVFINAFYNKNKKKTLHQNTAVKITIILVTRRNNNIIYRYNNNIVTKKKKQIQWSTSRSNCASSQTHCLKAYPPQWKSSATLNSRCLRCQCQRFAPPLSAKNNNNKISHKQFFFKQKKKFNYSR